MKSHQDASAPVSNTRCDFSQRFGVGSGTNALKTIALLGILFAVLSAPVNPAHAIILRFDYTGNEFEFVEGPYTTSDKIMGYFVAEMPALENAYEEYTSNVTDYSFTDGIQTISQSDPPPHRFFGFTTNASGDLIEWAIYLGSYSSPEFQIQIVNLRIAIPNQADIGSTDSDGLEVVDDVCIGGAAGLPVLPYSDEYGCNLGNPGSLKQRSSKLFLSPRTLPLFLPGLAGIALMGWKRRAWT